MKWDIDPDQIAAICQNIVVFFASGRCCAGGEISRLVAFCLKANVLRDEARYRTALAVSGLDGFTRSAWRDDTTHIISPRNYPARGPAFSQLLRSFLKSGLDTTKKLQRNAVTIGIASEEQQP